MSLYRRHPIIRIELILDSGVHGTIGAFPSLSTPGQRCEMLSSIAAFFRGLFGRKDDDFKALLMSDLGIER